MEMTKLKPIFKIVDVALSFSLYVIKDWSKERHQASLKAPKEFSSMKIPAIKSEIAWGSYSPLEVF